MDGVQPILTAFIAGLTVTTATFIFVLKAMGNSVKSLRQELRDTMAISVTRAEFDIYREGEKEHRRAMLEMLKTTRAFLASLDTELKAVNGRFKRGG